MTYDVIVVGSGSAGLAAAIAAAESGAKTLMIEKNPALGGTSGWSVGSITTSSSPHQRAADIYDTPDDHFADMELFHGERLKGRDNLKLRRLLVDKPACALAVALEDTRCLRIRMSVLQEVFQSAP